METCLVQWSHTQAGQTTESVIHPSGVEIVDKEALTEVNVQVRGRSHDWLFFLEEGSLEVPSEKIHQNFSRDCSSPCMWWWPSTWMTFNLQPSAVMMTFNLDVQLWPIIVGSLACFRNPSNKSLISTSKGMSGLTTRDEVEFNVRCFVGSRCHGFGRAFLERFIFIKSFLNVVCSKVDQRVVNSQPRFSKNHIVLIQGKHSESLCGLKIVQFQCYRRCYRVRLRTYTAIRARVTENFLFVVWVSRLLLSTKRDDTKSCVDPQSIRTRASWPDKDPLNLNKSEEQLLESERLLISGLPGTETEVPFPVSEFKVEVPGGSRTVSLIFQSKFLQTSKVQWVESRWSNVSKRGFPRKVLQVLQRWHFRRTVLRVLQWLRHDHENGSLVQEERVQRKLPSPMIVPRESLADVVWENFRTILDKMTGSTAFEASSFFH